MTSESICRWVVTYQSWSCKESPVSKCPFPDPNPSTISPKFLTNLFSRQCQGTFSQTRIDKHVSESQRLLLIAIISVAGFDSTTPRKTCSQVLMFGGARFLIYYMFQQKIFRAQQNLGVMPPNATRGYGPAPRWCWPIRNEAKTRAVTKQRRHKFSDITCICLTSNTTFVFGNRRKSESDQPESHSLWKRDEQGKPKVTHSYTMPGLAYIGRW